MINSGLSLLRSLYILADQTVYQALQDRLSKNLPGWPAGPWTDVYALAATLLLGTAGYPNRQVMLDALVASEGEPDLVQISGGEPTLHPQFWEILDAAKALGVGAGWEKHLGVANAFGGSVPVATSSWRWRCAPISPITGTRSSARTRPSATSPGSRS